MSRQTDGYCNLARLNNTNGKFKRQAIMGRMIVSSCCYYAYLQQDRDILLTILQPLYIKENPKKSIPVVKLQGNRIDG